jgi:hypothetical protein
MKKYLLGFAAIVLALSFSAFTSSESSKGKFQDVYWFAVDQHNISSGAITQGDVSFIVKNTGTTPSASCTGTPTNYCLVNFTDVNKVVEMPAGSGLYQVNGTQTPDNITSRRQ